MQYLLKKRKEAKEKVDKTKLLATTVQRLAADHTTESTVSVVNLPNDEMKVELLVGRSKYSYIRNAYWYRFNY